MKPQELIETLKTAILRKEVRLKQGEWGVMVAEGMWALDPKREGIT